jgi:ankyrin repeat protein
MGLDTITSHCFCFTGKYKEAIQLLFSHGARDDIKNMSGKTASDIAFEHHQFELSTLKSQKKL